MPILIQRCSALKDVEVVEIDNEGLSDEQIMLGTIRVPKNLRLLSERLPKSNYGSASKKPQLNKLESAESTKVISKMDTGSA
jgi:hypothetical protein